MDHAARFLFQPHVQGIFDAFTRLLGIRIVFFSYDGEELNAGDNRPPCRFCQLLREQLGYEETCRQLDRRQQATAARTRKRVAYRCHGGMVEAVLPVYHVSTLIGFVMIGQFRMTDHMPDTVQDEWGRRFRDDSLQEAFLATPCYTGEQLDSILELFEGLVGFIVAQRLIALRRHAPIDTIIQYIDDHPAQTFSLNEAARLISRSPSTVAHLFKQATGQSFRHYQIDRRMQLAEEMLRTRANMTIGQIALELGYEDPLYFSRLFKSHRGVTPSAFRRLSRAAGEG